MSKAYGLAAKLDSADPTSRQTEIDAADELRKLAQINAELLEALQVILNNNESLVGEATARTAIAKATKG